MHTRFFSVHVMCSSQSYQPRLPLEISWVGITFTKASPQLIQLQLPLVMCGIPANNISVVGWSLGVVLAVWSLVGRTVLLCRGRPCHQPQRLGRRASISSRRRRNRVLYTICPGTRRPIKQNEVKRLMMQNKSTRTDLPARESGLPDAVRAGLKSRWWNTCCKVHS